MRRLALSVFLLAALAACQSTRPLPNQPLPAGRWRYVARLPRSDSWVAQGYLALEPADRRTGGFTGTWDIDAMGRRNVGPQDGRGELAGTLDGRDLRINFQPRARDNNIWLIGTLRSNDRIEGRCEHVGFGGVMTAGTFVATRSE